MITFDKRQLTAISNFCDRFARSGISYFGNAIEASNGLVAMRIQYLAGIKEEKVRIPRAALLAAIAAMSKDDLAVISADGIKVNAIRIEFDEPESFLFDDLAPVFRDINDGTPSKFVLFDTTCQNKLNAAIAAFGIGQEKEYGSKERNFYISGQNELFYIQVAMVGKDPNEKEAD